ncbi:hypothetical protein Nepgr_020348 [Nepenthes gracilis]|uniref:Secreted protein n=1 Tax=Nepenthes gracilis TaxID=150966 RepID=A0AAD3XV01_NEPGR|nr:hypothetical protein Nepgr_020348 [Nepenthes gracilis]
MSYDVLLRCWVLLLAVGFDGGGCGAGKQCCVLSPGGAAPGYGRIVVTGERLLNVVGVVDRAAMHLLAGTVAL